jgi:hypothetical protein
MNNKIKKKKLFVSGILSQQHKANKQNENWGKGGIITSLHSLIHRFKIQKAAKIIFPHNLVDDKTY